MVVPGEGFEPSRGCPRLILSQVRLPFRHPGTRRPILARLPGDAWRLRAGVLGTVWGVRGAHRVGTPSNEPPATRRLGVRWAVQAGTSAESFADVPTEGCPEGTVIEFTFLWKEAQRSEGRNYSVRVSGPK